MGVELQPGHAVALGDWLACAWRGAREPAARAAREAGGDLQDRVAAAGVAGHVLDFDDTYLPGVAHLSAATAPAALVLGAELEATVEQALAAFAAGFEAMGALARASHPALYDGGWHPTAVCGGVGSAVTAARLLGLGPEQEGAAVGLALLRASGLRSAFGSAGKSIQVGLASASGVAAARLAAAGAEVDADRVATGVAGYEEAFGGTYAEPVDGRSAVAENWIKAYPCCLQTHGAIEAALLAAEYGPPEGTIVVAIHPLSRQAAPVDMPCDGLEAKFSIPYLTAFAMVRGAPAVDDFEAVDAEALHLAERVTVRSDAGLGESEAILEVDAAPAVRIEAALGSPQRPMDDAALAAKGRSLAGDALEGALEDTDRPAADLLAPLGLA